METSTKNVIFRKFHSIQNIKNMLYANNTFLTSFNDPIVFKSKVKLHGTNACVIVSSDGVFAQKRKSMCTPECDNHGFARWVYSWSDEIDVKQIPHGPIVRIYGEWAGKGVQKTVAISESDKSFYVFMVVIENAFSEDEVYLVEPDEISDRLEVLGITNMKVIPWYSRNEVSINNVPSMDSFGRMLYV